MNEHLIGNRIKERREELNITQEQLAMALGLNKSTVQRYETGQVKKIKIPILHSIAKFLDVNPDWLALKTDTQTEYIDGDSYAANACWDEDEIHSARQRALEVWYRKGFTTNLLEDTFGVGFATFKPWCNGYGSFFNDKIPKLAEFLGVSLDYLIGWSDSESTNSEIFHVPEDEGTMLYCQLDDNDRAEIRGEMKQMLKAAKYNMADSSSTNVTVFRAARSDADVPPGEVEMSVSDLEKLHTASTVTSDDDI